MAGRKRAAETAEEVIGPDGGAVPPTEGWLLRKLAELRRAERHGDRTVAKDAGSIKSGAKRGTR
jgi:hypothetical protein